MKVIKTQSASSPVLPPLLTEFTIFRKLPAELRLMVWNFALQNETEPTSGVIEVLYHTESGRYRTEEPTPPLLRVCREARIQALKKKYSLLELRMGPNDNVFRTYIDYSCQVLFPAEHLIQDQEDFESTPMARFLVQLNLHPEASQKLKPLMLPGGPEKALWQESKSILWYIARMRGIKRLLIDCGCCHRDLYGRRLPNTRVGTMDWRMAPCIPIQSIDYPAEMSTIAILAMRQYSHHTVGAYWEKEETEWALEDPVAVLSKMASSSQSESEFSVDDLEAMGYRTDWSGVTVEVMESIRNCNDS